MQNMKILDDFSQLGYNRDIPGNNKKAKVRKYNLFEAKVNAKTISYGVIIQAVNVYLNIVNPSSIHYPR